MNPLLGQIMPIALATMPPNMLLCDGATYLKADYPNLYAILDSAFIVDATHFSVPDLSSRVVVGAGHGSGLSNYNVNAQGGEEQNVLSVIELAEHAHNLNDPGHVHRERVSTGVNASVFTSGGGGNSTVGSAATLGTSPLNTLLNTTGMTMDNSGSGNGHNNIQPYTALKYGIVAY